MSVDQCRVDVPHICNACGKTFGLKMSIHGDGRRILWERAICPKCGSLDVDEIGHERKSKQKQ